MVAPPATIFSVPLTVTLLNSLVPDAAVTLPVKSPVTFPVTLPVTLPVILPAKLVVAVTKVPVIVWAELLPITVPSILPPSISTLLPKARVPEDEVMLLRFKLPVTVKPTKLVVPFACMSLNALLELPKSTSSSAVGSII